MPDPRLDTHLLKHNVTKLYAQSGTIQKRLERWGNIPSEVLYPPPPQRDYRTESYQNFIFTVSRLHKLKRIDLLVEAFRYVKNKDLKAFIIGEGPEREHSDPADPGITVWKTGSISWAQRTRKILCRTMPAAWPSFSVPLNEDYGLVTAEAFASGKPVVTDRRTAAGRPSWSRTGNRGSSSRPIQRDRRKIRPSRRDEEVSPKSWDRPDISSSPA